IEAGELTPAPGDAPASGSTISCLTLSASSEAALQADAARIAGYLAAHPESYPKVLRHLQAGRPVGRFRAAVACREVTAAVSWLRRVAEAGGEPAGNATAASEYPVHDVAVRDVAVRDAAVRDAAAEGLAAGDAEPADLVRAWLAGAAIR